MMSPTMEALQVVVAAKATLAKVSIMARNVSVTRGMLRHPCPLVEHRRILARGCTSARMTVITNDETAGLTARMTIGVENATIRVRGATEMITGTNDGGIQGSQWNMNDRHSVPPPLLTSDLLAGTYHGGLQRQWF